MDSEICKLITTIPFAQFKNNEDEKYCSIIHINSKEKGKSEF